MKIKESELKQIIKEETLRLKKLILLEKEKTQIRKQLAEYGYPAEVKLTEDEASEVESLLSQEIGSIEQQAQPEAGAQPQAGAPTMDEAFLGKFGEKIKGAAKQATTYAQNIADQQIKKLSPEQIQTLKQWFAPFQGKNIAQLVGLVKGKLEEGVLTEAMDIADIKDRVSKVLKAIGIGGGALGVIAGVAGMVALQIIKFFPTVSPLFYGGAIAVGIGITLHTIGKALERY